MNPADYDAWYATPRGRWIGDAEYALAARLLAPQAGDSLPDVGCGTGWFTRRAAPRPMGLSPLASILIPTGWITRVRTAVRH